MSLEDFDARPDEFYERIKKPPKRPTSMKL